MGFPHAAALFAVAALAAPPVLAGAGTSDDALDQLLSLSLEELGEVTVTTASPRAERLADAPASVFVIHRDDIRRLGIHSLPEALRLAPNLQVAQVNASAHAVTARGLKTELGNKLLDAFRAPFSLQNVRVEVGLTIGYAIAPHDGNDAIGLLKLADAAMYSGKQGGKFCLRRNTGDQALSSS